MIDFVGNATEDEIRTLSPILRDIASELPIDRMTAATGNSTDGMTEFESTRGTVRVIVMWKTTRIMLDPDMATSRQVAHLGIGDPELRPSIQFALHEDCAPFDEDIPNAEARCASRIRRCVEIMDSFGPVDPERTSGMETMLSSVAGAVGAWSIQNGMPEDGRVEISASAPSKRTKVLWCLGFPMDGNEAARNSIQEWAASKIPFVIDASSIREKQTLCLRMDVARRTISGDADPVSLMRHASQHPDMPR